MVDIDHLVQQSAAAMPLSLSVLQQLVITIITIIIFLPLVAYDPKG